MKKKVSFIALGFLLTSSSLNAQYQIDLRNVTSVPLTQLPFGHSGPKGKEIRVNNLYMEEGGVPVLPVMGEFHYNRIDSRYWKDALLKMKASGVNIVSTYVLWLLHEETEGKQSWDGNNDLRYFIELCKEIGLKVHLRIGPYCNAEILNGALPDWIAQNHLFRARTNDPLYLEYVRKWYRSIFHQVNKLLYKDGGPVMAVQLENEYVTKGMVISHLMNLKRIAVEEGFDVPLYSMTHWLDSEYPKGEIVPYAGFYIETPWVTNGREMTPPTAFEFFTYNRVSDNIGTDIVKVEGEIESLGGAACESPFFTCEIGVGTTTFYNRRAVVPEEMAGENINLRLGCGANLMGYYMYVGGTNPVGKKNVFANNPSIGYDYQAPIREFGTLGVVMKETKKLNYFMNDYGRELAPKSAYLPLSNRNRDNLQWAVRSDGNAGFIFCSNYLYKHDRKDYKKVQFDIWLKEGLLKIPRNKTTVRNGAYFLWPFNMDLKGVQLKYATVQPICKHTEGRVNSFFFFADDGIPGEYMLHADSIRGINIVGGKCKKENDSYFISITEPGKGCVVSVVKTNGEEIRLITLREEDSDYLWKGVKDGTDFVAITRSSLIYDHDSIVIMDERPEQEIWLYQPETSSFIKQIFTHKKDEARQGHFFLLPPMNEAGWIYSSQEEPHLRRTFVSESLSDIREATLRCLSRDSLTCFFNGTPVKLRSLKEYSMADVTPLFKSGKNDIGFGLKGQNGVLAEIEITYKNGERVLWNTDNTWLSGKGNAPVIVRNDSDRPTSYAPEEHIAIYEYAPSLAKTERELRLKIGFVGNMATAYIGGRMVNNCYYDGTEWTLGLSRYKDLLRYDPLIVKVRGFHSTDEQIYFESFANPREAVFPKIKNSYETQEYRYVIR